MSAPNDEEPPPEYPGGLPVGQPANGYGQPPPNGQQSISGGYGQQPMNGSYGQSLPLQPMSGQLVPGQPGYGPQAMTEQPMANMQPQAPPAQWMTRPEPFAGCPPGLEYLSRIDSLQVQQEIDMLEVMYRRHRRNKYRISNAEGLQVYFANEETEEWQLSYGNRRGWILHITDNQGNEIMRVMKVFSQCGAGCHCCADSDRCKLFVDVECPPGNRVGQIKQDKSCMQAMFKIEDVNENVVLRLDGPDGCGGCCTRDTQFTLKSADGSTEVGNVTKMYMGLMERVTMADTFGVNFPADLDVKVKALVLGALFLIDYRYFQVQNQQHSRRRR